VIELRSGFTALIVILCLKVVSGDVFGQYSGIELLSVLNIIHAVKHGAYQIHENMT
jgi:hypothetical protein